MGGSASTVRLATQLGDLADGAVTLTVAGELDLASAPQLQSAVADQLRPDRPLVLDLSGLEFIDSTGITALLTLCRGADGRGCRVQIDPHMQPQVARIIDMTGVLEQLPLAGTDITPAPRTTGGR